MKDNDGDNNQIHCVLVGDCTVGKTNLIHSYATDQFCIQYVPTVFDHYTSEVEVFGSPTILDIWDLSGKEEHYNLRKFAYSKA